MRFKLANEAERNAAQVLVTDLYREHALTDRDMYFPDHWHVVVGLDSQGSVRATVSLVAQPPLPLEPIWPQELSALQHLGATVAQMTCFASHSQRFIVGTLAKAMQLAEPVCSHLMFAIDPEDFPFYFNSCGAFRLRRKVATYPYAMDAAAIPVAIDVGAASMHRHYARWMRRLI